MANSGFSKRNFQDSLPSRIIVNMRNSEMEESETKSENSEIINIVFKINTN